MSPYYIDAELTSMIATYQEDVYDSEVHPQSYNFLSMHLRSVRIIKIFFPIKQVIFA